MKPSWEKYLPPQIKHILQARSPVRDVNREHCERLTTLECLAVAANNALGTPAFVLIVVGGTVAWILWHAVAYWFPAALGPTLQGEFPKFEVWAVVAGCIQLFLLPLLLIAQNLQDKHAQARAENDYEVNLKAEREIAYLFQHLEYQNAVLQAMAEKLGVDMDEVNRHLNLRSDPADD